MKKYGYRNIASRNEFEESAQKEGSHEFSYNSGKHLTNQGFINWGNQTNWGLPGQTKYGVKDLKDLLGAADKVSSTNS